MTIKKNIHPIYFNSFVGTWKRMSIKGSNSNGYLKFNRDCTFENDGSLKVHEGTVNGDVDEISVDDDGHGHDRKKFQTDVIKGKAVLTTESKKEEWSFRMGKGRSMGFKNNKIMLELRKNRSRVIYVGNLPLADEKAKFSTKKGAKV